MNGHGTLKQVAFIFCLLLMSFKQDQRKVAIYSIGDSTMAYYNTEKLSEEFGGKNYPIHGWMMMMPPFFNDQVVIHNEAISGRSSKSFRDQGHWKRVLDNIQPGDYVFIQFGHNDAKKSDTSRYTEPNTSFRQNLINYVNETKAKGAHPILFTSITRRKFDSLSNLIDTHGGYVTVVRELARQMNIPLVDLYKKTADLVQRLGPEESKKLFMYIEPGLFTKLPDGEQDDTHLNSYGATRVAELAVQGLKELNSPLSVYLKP